MLSIDLRESNIEPGQDEVARDLARIRRRWRDLQCFDGPGNNGLAMFLMTIASTGRIPRVPALVRGAGDARDADGKALGPIGGYVDVP
jgi:hypothetical protein